MNAAMPVDVAAIREAVATGLNVWGVCPEVELAPTLRQELEGYVALLRVEVLGMAPRMRGEMRATAVHVLVRVHQLLDEASGSEGAALSVPDLAVMARSLVTLYESPGRLGEPVGADDIRDAVDRRICGACQKPVAAGEAYVQRVYDGGTGPECGFEHTEPCAPAQSRRPELTAVSPLGSLDVADVT